MQEACPVCGVSRASQDPQPKGPSWRKQTAAAPPPPVTPLPGSSPGVTALPTGAPGWKGGPPQARSSLGDWFKSRKGKVITAIALTGVAIAVFILLVLA